MATLPTDAQRVVAISLGKLASSRSQRGGPLLHKSLLLTTVLHRARSAFMMESMQSMIARRQQQQTEPQTVPTAPVVEPERPATPVPCVPEEQPSVPSACKRARVEAEQDSDDECDKENSVPPVPSGYQDRLPGDSDSDSEDIEAEEGENTDSPRCVKRRLSPDSAESPESKRPRVGISHRNSCDTPLDSNNKGSSPVQSDCLQISTLVSKFNSGLSGILGGSNNNNCSEHTKNSENGMGVSCRTIQVKEGFESMSRAVIALTV